MIRSHMGISFHSAAARASVRDPPATGPHPFTLP